MLTGGNPDCSQRASPSPLPADDGSNEVFDLVIFLELFAGEGQLSCTLRDAGLDVLPPTRFGRGYGLHEDG